MAGILGVVLIILFVQGTDKLLNSIISTDLKLEIFQSNVKSNGTLSMIQFVLLLINIVIVGLSIFALIALGADAGDIIFILLGLLGVVVGAVAAFNLNKATKVNNAYDYYTQTKKGIQLFMVGLGITIAFSLVTLFAPGNDPMTVVQLIQFIGEIVTLVVLVISLNKLNSMTSNFEEAEMREPFKSIY